MRESASNPYAAPVATAQATPSVLQLELHAKPELLQERELWDAAFPARQIFIFAIVISAFAIAFLLQAGNSLFPMLIMLGGVAIRLWSATFEATARRLLYKKHLRCNKSASVEMTLDQTSIQIRHEGYSGRLEYLLAREFILLPKLAIVRVPLLASSAGIACTWRSLSGNLNNLDLRRHILRHVAISGDTTKLTKLAVDDLPLCNEIAQFERDLYLNDAPKLARLLCWLARLQLISTYVFLLAITLGAILSSMQGNHFWLLFAAFIVYMKRGYFNSRLFKFVFTLNPLLSEHRMIMFEDGLEYASNAGVFRIRYDALSHFAVGTEGIGLFHPFSDEPTCTINPTYFQGSEDAERVVDHLTTKLTRTV